jgi:hypothetical protein
MPKTKKPDLVHKVTAEDLERNPKLKAADLVAGDTITIPAEAILPAGSNGKFQVVRLDEGFRVMGPTGQWITGVIPEAEANDTAARHQSFNR